MTTRRRFLMMVPASGAVLAAACSKQEGPTAAAPAPAPAPASAEPPTAAAPAPAAPAESPSASGPMVEATDPTAVALGYVALAANVDKIKHANFVEGSNCANCSLYQGSAGSEAGPCPLFAGKQVAAAGWCASYVKKAA
ncbi:MAG: high-potential iron-sulfur protein [Hydrogenophaga sp.]|nr:high-potential iron-sulfur protein [Hydrogenophaga sp.]MDO8904185.1 high-potential iron-sulfur protein [Hydrogenophaga sp.]